MLCYHGVREGFEPGISAVPADRLAFQLDYLTGRGWQPEDQDAAPSRAQGLAVTLDDGLAGQVEHWALPLAQRGFRATLFVPVGFVGAAARWDYMGRRRRHAPWSQLADWCSAGHAVGSHGMNHRDLRPLSDAELKVEIADSRKLLEDRLGVPVASFSYPFGRWNSRVARHVREAGYAQAFTASPTSASGDPWSRPRIVVSCLDTEIAIETRARTSLWGSVERGKQRIITFWSGGTALRQTWFHRMEKTAA